MKKYSKYLSRQCIELESEMLLYLCEMCPKVTDACKSVLNSLSSTEEARGDAVFTGVSVLLVLPGVVFTE